MKTAISVVLMFIGLLVIAFPFIGPTADAAPAPATVSGKVVSWASNNAPMKGVTVELRKGPFNTLVAKTTTNAKGEFKFANVALSSGASFAVKAYVGYHQAAWYFQLSPGGTAGPQTMKLS